jgi:hypothetical protein
LVRALPFLLRNPSVKIHIREFGLEAYDAQVRMRVLPQYGYIIQYNTDLLIMILTPTHVSAAAALFCLFCGTLAPYIHTYIHTYIPTSLSTSSKALRPPGTPCGGASFVFWVSD